MVVVLPAPLGPSRPKHSPARTSRSRPLTASTGPPRALYCFRRSRQRIATSMSLSGPLAALRAAKPQAARVFDSARYNTMIRTDRRTEEGPAMLKRLLPALTVLLLPLTARAALNPELDKKYQLQVV